MERDADGELRFQRADGCTIPRFGYRVDDFVDDDVVAVDSDDENPSAEVREPAAIYRLTPSGREARVSSRAMAG